MAILKHKTSKNSRYGDVLDYYTYRHTESPKTGCYEPILDENGLMIPRDNYAVAYITASGEEKEPELWASACIRTNLIYGKNKTSGDRKNHEYIIAHPVEDNISVEELLDEGRAFARDNLAGYDCLIGAHDNHVHITINSIRAKRREYEEAWMMRDDEGQVLPCEMEAGCKHQDSPGLKQHLHDWVLNYCREHDYVQKDNNAIAAVHRAERHGSKNDHMRAALLEVAGRSCNMKDLCRIMKAEYGMDVKISNTGKTISILYPGNEKYVRLRTLNLEPVDLTRRFVGDAYIFTREERGKRFQEELEKKMKKEYTERIAAYKKEYREMAENMILQAEYLLAEELRGRGERYYRNEFQDLNLLIRQTSYIYASLQTEKAKTDSLLARWNHAEDMSLTNAERGRHRSYVLWCGCDPDNETELRDLQLHSENIAIQQNRVLALHDALLGEALLWKGRNELTYSETKLQWLEHRESQLQHRMHEMNEKGKQLHIAYYYCRRAALIAGCTRADLWEKVENLDAAFSRNTVQRYMLRQQIKEVRQKKYEAKKEYRQTEKMLNKGRQ